MIFLLILMIIEFTRNSVYISHYRYNSFKENISTFPFHFMLLIIPLNNFTIYALKASPYLLY